MAWRLWYRENEERMQTLGLGQLLFNKPQLPQVPTQKQLSIFIFSQLSLNLFFSVVDLAQPLRF